MILFSSATAQQHGIVFPIIKKNNQTKIQYNARKISGVIVKGSHSFGLMQDKVRRVQKPDRLQCRHGKLELKNSENDGNGLVFNATIPA